MFEDTNIKRYQMREAGIIALDWQKVYEWTQAQPAGTALGESRTNTLDPLGNYLNEQTGTQKGYWSIGPSIKNGYGDRLQKPDWVKRLIFETDDLSAQNETITREIYLATSARRGARHRPDKDGCADHSFTGSGQRRGDRESYEACELAERPD